jgi:hypothetical protein
VAWGAVRRRLSIYVAGSALAVLLFSWNLTAFLLNSLYILMATFYSLPPIRFKARPFLDSFSNWFYIIPGAAGYHLSSNNLLPPLWFWVVGALWTAGMHALSAVPDIEPDRRAGIKTIATTLGPRGTMFFCLRLLDDCSGRPSLERPTNTARLHIPGYSALPHRTSRNLTELLLEVPPHKHCDGHAGLLLRRTPPHTNHALE